jgi:hypothetical protein
MAARGAPGDVVAQGEPRRRQEVEARGKAQLASQPEEPRVRLQDPARAGRREHGQHAVVQAGERPALGRVQRRADREGDVQPTGGELAGECRDLHRRRRHDQPDLACGRVHLRQRLEVEDAGDHRVRRRAGEGPAGEDERADGRGGCRRERAAM